MGEIGDKNGNHLDVKTHQRSESGYSNNYSLLEMYGESDEEEIMSSQAGLKLTSDSSNVDSNLMVPNKKLTNGINSGNSNSNGKVNDNREINKIKNEVRENAKQNYVKLLTSKKLKELVNGDFDRYGFKKVSLHQTNSKEEYNSWFNEYVKYSNERKKKWELLMKSNGLSIGSENENKVPNRFPPKSDKVKKLIRRGIPGEWRGNAWFFYAGGYERLNKHVGIYDKIVRDTMNISNKDTEAIERDLYRTFPDNIYFNSSLTQKTPSQSNKKTNNNNTNTNVEEVKEDIPMIKSLRRVLVSFSHYQPQIGYCQSLNFLAGLLLLFMNEERVFWMLVILTERLIPKVHSIDLEGVHTDQGVLMLCIKEYIPQLWSILGKNFEGETLSEDKILLKLPPVTLVTSSWFMSVFVGILPVESTLRIWDILWYEGSKTLFRFSLTICRMCLDSEKFKIGNNNNNNNSKRNSENNFELEQEQIELFQFMQSYPKTLINPNEIIDNCFKKIGGYGYGSLSQDEINKCRAFVSKQRDKLKKKSLSTNLSEEERKVLNNTDQPNVNDISVDGDGDIHDVYGFHRSIMSGVAWNNNISNKMKKRFSRKSR